MQRRFSKMKLLSRRFRANAIPFPQCLPPPICDVICYQPLSSGTETAPQRALIDFCHVMSLLNVNLRSRHCISFSLSLSRSLSLTLALFPSPCHYAWMHAENDMKRFVLLTPARGEARRSSMQTFGERAYCSS